MEAKKNGIFKRLGLNRRNFIKFLVGGTVGVHLTPLPWKLIDDVAIWTQNWSWVPVPAKGKFTQANTLCTLCPGSCGISVRKVDERPVHIAGQENYPINSGSICPLGAGGLQLLYNENIRFTSPMKRVGPKGSGQFERISWEEALKILSDKIKELRHQQKPETLAAIDGNPAGSSMSLLIQRFLEAVGSPHYLTIPSAEDTYAMANLLMQGHAGSPAYDLENADFILSFGCGLLEGWGAPGRVLHAWSLWRQESLKSKVKIIQIEARASNTASKADQWMAITPGTETALALGLAHVLVKQGLYHKEFVEHFTFGFNDWTGPDNQNHMGFKRLVLEKYAPETVARITGLKAEEIVNLAIGFSQARAPLALCGKGKAHLNGNLFEYMAIQALNALRGNINQPGGSLVLDPLPLKAWPDIKPDAIAKNGLQKPRLDQAGSPSYPFTPSLIHKLSEAIQKSSKPVIDTLLIFSANPVYTLPGNATFKQALPKIPFIVSFSPYQDETALSADLILPDHTYLEKMEDRVSPTGLPYPLYGLTQPIIKPLYDTRQSGDVLIKLAGLLGNSVKAALPWNNFEEAIKERAEGLFKAAAGLTSFNPAAPVWDELHKSDPIKADYQSLDDMWQKIKSSGLWYQPRHAFQNWDKIFKTSSKKFEFFSTTIERAIAELAKTKDPKAVLTSLGIKAEGDEALLPHYEAGPSLVGKDQYPLLLIPYELINLSSNWLPNPPYLNKTLFDHILYKNECFAEINPSTAADYHLRDGDRVVISSVKGRIKVRVNFFAGAMPGVLFLPLGFGHSAYDDFQKAKGVNPLEILDLSHDPLSGLPAWWNTYVKIEKA
jgi:anaerobic selenocysteine-containing dehydrogenase